MAMPAFPDPEFEATVSPLLRDLLRPGPAGIDRDQDAREESSEGPYDGRMAEGDVGETLVDPVETKPEAACDDRGSAPVEGNSLPFKKTVLRRDGGRPLVVSAVLLAEHISKEPVQPVCGWRRRLALYLTKESEIAAQLSLVPDAEDLARPVFVASMLSHEADLERLNEQCRPPSVSAEVVSGWDMPGIVRANA